ncbi:MAG: universal stress protein [Pseudomonadota bacterium]
MDKTILIASDLTARSDRPFLRAALLAEEWDAKRAVLFANSDKSRVDQDSVEHQLRRNYGEDMDAVSVVVAHGKVPETIAKTARGLEANIIVVGAARHNNVTDFFLGTAVDYVVRQAQAPVLVVKERAHHAYQKIMVAVDFSESSKNAVQTALTMFPKAHITIAHAFHVAYSAWLKSEGVAQEMRGDAEKGMEDFINDLALGESDKSRITTAVLEGNLHQSIYDMLLKQDMDLLVLGTHGRSGFTQATIGSRASEMLGWAPTDVLMVRGN